MERNIPGIGNCILSKYEYVIVMSNLKYIEIPCVCTRTPMCVRASVCVCVCDVIFLGHKNGRVIG